VVGLSQGLETLCGQSWGAGDKAALGVHLQRGVAIQLALALPVTLLFWFSEGFLTGWLRQDAGVAAVCARYLRAAPLSLVASSVVESLRRFLGAQGNTAVPSACSLFGSLLVPLAVPFFVVPGPWSLGLGAAGGILVMGLSHAANAILQMIYIACWPGPHRVAWTGWKPRDALARWWDHLAVSVPAAALTCIEWWSFESEPAGVVVLRQRRTSCEHVPAPLVLSEPASPRASAPTPSPLSPFRPSRPRSIGVAAAPPGGVGSRRPRLSDRQPGLYVSSWGVNGLGDACVGGPWGGAPKRGPSRVPRRRGSGRRRASAPRSHHLLCCTLGACLLFHRRRRV